MQGLHVLLGGHGRGAHALFTAAARVPPDLQHTKPDMTNM